MDVKFSIKYRILFIITLQLYLLINNNIIIELQIKLKNGKFIIIKRILQIGWDYLHARIGCKEEVSKTEIKTLFNSQLKFYV